MCDSSDLCCSLLTNNNRDDEAIRIRISRKRKPEHSLEELVNMMSDDDHEKFMHLIRRKRTKDNEESVIEKLPKEMWLLVLGKLKQKDLVTMSMTCKHFRRLCLSILKDMYLPLHSLVQNPDFVTQFISRCTNLKTLKIEEHVKPYVNVLHLDEDIKVKACFDV